MLNEKDIAALLKAPTRQQNLLAGPWPDQEVGDKMMRLAVPTWRGWAQNIINSVEEHRHLRSSRIVLVVEYSESTMQKLRRGDRVSIGRAHKASLRERLLSARSKDASDTVDFIVRVSGDFYSLAKELHDAEGADRQMLALIDHELSHCGAKVAGKFVELAKAPELRTAKGEDWIEQTTVKNADGKVLCRWYARDGGSYVWTMRKHEVEEFCGVAGRHGKWTPQLGRLVDELETDEAKPAELLPANA